MEFELLKQMHGAGASLEQIARRFETNAKVISRICVSQGLRRKPTLTLQQRQRIRELADAYSIRQIARMVGCSPSQAGFWVIVYREQDARRRGEIAPRRLNTPRRCPVHGLVNLWPCVACAAIGANPDA